ncbi:ATP-binding protein, partial [Erwinia amylovora]|uniref:ATP-binding protein n=1 Tax=Erwinia amylovora TaxID=552 RepID=UPI0020C033DE
VKFTRQGESLVRVGYQSEECMRFDFQDSCIGITQDELAKIFASYYHVKDRRGVKPATGTGIGQPVSLRQHLSMVGDIIVSGAPGIGTCLNL